MDGQLDPGEPGIEGVVVDLRCAGPDGVLGTGDDLLLSTTTDANGNYLFDQLLADTCEVTVDVSTAPEDKVPGQCPTVVNVDLGVGESFLDADFCFETPPGEIGDTVYCDLDDDGVEDPGEPGIPGVDVRLRCAGPDGVLNTADDLLRTETTDANGNYLFTEVPPGVCRVSVDTSTGPEDKIPGQCPTQRTFTLLAGQSRLDADFCFVFPPPGMIGDLVYCDLDDDGVLDPGEPGIAGVTIDLVCAGDDGVLGTADDVSDSRVTDADGGYLFEEVTPGLCEVTVDVSTGPVDKDVGLCPTTVAVDLQSGEAFLDADFCFVNRTGEIGDTVYCDLDDDGVQDPGEPGIAGVTVDLVCAGDDGVLGTADDLTDSQTTDGNGLYLFTGIPASMCEVSVDVGTAPADKLPGRCPTLFAVDLQPGQSFLDADFCFVSPGTIGDTVFCDTDDDGVQDPGEPGIAGVTVDLLCAGNDGVIGTADDLSDSQTTDANGFYLFTDVPAGMCQVDVDVNSAPFDKEPGVCPVSVTVSLAPGEAFLDADFCFRNLPPSDCCENGKPVVLFMQYTGEDCSATSNTQDEGKVSCEGDPAFAPTVFVRATDKEDPFDTGGRIYFEGDVDLNATFAIDATVAGEDKLSSNTFVHVFDLAGNLLQTIEFHTSCSQDLFTGDQFGSVLLVGCIGEDEPIPGDVCGGNKPRTLTMRYTGEDCSATSNNQDESKVTCIGDPAFEPIVHILSSNKEDPADDNAKIWFQGDVGLDTTFVIDAALAGENRLESNTWVHVFDLAGNLLQSVEFHTSCSQPLALGDQFGSLLLEGFTADTSLTVTPSRLFRVR